MYNMYYVVAYIKLICYYTLYYSYSLYSSTSTV